MSVRLWGVEVVEEENTLMVIRLKSVSEAV